MRTLPALTIGLILLLLAAGAIAWLLPPRLTPAQLRPLVERMAAARLHADIRIDGNVALTLLPRPVLVARQVSVQGAGGLHMVVSELRLDLVPAALLAGRIEAESLKLRGVALRLPWPLDPRALLGRVPDWTLGGAVAVEGATLMAGDATLGGIEGSLAVDPVTHAVRIDASVTLAGRDWRAAGQASAPGGDGAVGVQLTLTAPGTVAARLSGQIAPDGGFAGHVSAEGSDLSRLLPAPAAAFTADGRLTVGGGLAAADDLAVTAGAQSARGAVALRWTPALRLDVALASGRLDLDQWVDAVAAGRGALHPPLPVGLDISADAASLRQGTLRDLRLDLDVTDGMVDLHEAQATLPGEASLHLTGGGTPTDLAGEVRFKAPDVPATATWLSAAGWLPRIDPALLPRAAEGHAHLHLTPARFAVEAAGGKADGHALAGSLGVGRGAAGRIAAVLDADQLDLDPFLPADESWPGWNGTLSVKARHATWQGHAIAPFALDGGADGGRVELRRLDGWLGAVHVTAAGHASDAGTSDLRIDDMALDVSSPNLAELRPLLPPRLPDLPRGSPMARDALALHLDATGPPASLAARVAASWGELRLDASPVIDLPDRTFHGRIALRDPGGRRLLDESGLLRAAGLDGDAAWLGEGSLALTGDVAVTADAVSVAAADLALGDFGATGELRLESGFGAPLLTGHITARALPLPGRGSVTDDLLPLSLLSGWKAAIRLEAASLAVDQAHWADDFATDLTLGGGRLRLDHIAARVAGGAATGALDFDSAAEPPALHGALQIVDATVAAPVLGWPVDVGGGRLSVDAAAEAAGHSAAALLATLRGHVEFDLRDATLAGLDLPRLAGLPADADIRAALASGRTPGVAGRIVVARPGDAAMTVTGSLDSPAATVALSGSLDAVDGLADLLLTLTPKRPSPPEIALRLSGPLASPNATPELAGLARWRSAQP